MTPWDKVIAIRNLRNMPHVQKIILFVIATHLGNNNFAYPSLTTLQEECGLARDNLSSNLNKLINSGYIQKLPPLLPKIKSNRYIVNFSVFCQEQSTTSSGKLLVVKNYQSSSAPLLDQEWSTTSLVVEHYPKEQLKEIKRNNNKKDIEHPRKKTAIAIPSRFEEFWNVYPIKKNKKKANEIWQRKKLDEKADFIIAHIVNRKERDQQWKDGFIPHATTFLNGERWDDEIKECRNEQSNRNTQSNGVEYPRYKNNSERTFEHLAKLSGFGKRGESFDEFEDYLSDEVPKLVSE